MSTKNKQQLRAKKFVLKMSSCCAEIEVVGSPLSCFASINWSLSPQNRDKVIQLRTDDDKSSGRTHWLSVLSDKKSTSSSEGGKVRLHSKLALNLGLACGQRVFVTETFDLPKVTSATLSCVSSDDWEILESNSEAVVNGLLHQLRVVYPGLVFPFWVTKSLQVNLKIDAIGGHSSCGILTDSSEVSIPAFVSSKPPPTMLTEGQFQLRVHPCTIPGSILASFPSSSILFKNVRNAFVFREGISEGGEESFFYAELLPLGLVVKVQFVDSLRDSVEEELLAFFRLMNPPCIYVHPNLGLELKTSVWVKIVKDPKEEEMTQLNPLPDGEGGESVLLPLFEKEVEECLSFIQASLSLGHVSHPFVGPRNGCLLIEGKTGSGKSTFFDSLKASLQSSPFFLHTELVSCAKWRGKKPETIEKELRVVLDRVEASSPSLLFLDDLDALTPSLPQEGGNPAEAFLQGRIFETLMASLMILGQVAVVATTSGSLHPFWKSREGFHFFHKVLHLPPLSPAGREALFLHVVRRHGKTPPPADSLFDTVHDQYATPRFVVNVARRFCALETPVETLLMEEVSLESGQEPSPLKVAWEDVGGLNKVKAELVRVLQWPVKYAHIFAKAPIRLPSGILLYGYPGTGKTLLALAIPSLLQGSSFIHVKGPQLLSKYIGGSEQAVQDVFRRARDSKPCVIFFDEFDSLVPRRGHDSTGVTDRVVNAFLTEMDGIEGGLGAGVYLIGATSRPDLIDPAVLRPGRLDRHLFFDLPTKDELTDLLHKLTKDKVTLISSSSSGESVEKAVQDMMDQMHRLNCTGADVQSLLSSAQLSAVKRHLADNQSPLINSQDCTSADIPVDIQKDLRSALSSLRPSLHGQNLERFKRFSGMEKGGGGKDRDLPAFTTGKRATLA